jgi:hypothetical protein
MGILTLYSRESMILATGELTELRNGIPVPAPGLGCFHLR